MKVLDQLVGIIEGIESDGVINQKEFEKLKNWIDDNYELHEDSVYCDVFRMLEAILEDGVIDEEEQEMLLDFANDYSVDHNTELESINILKGFLEGIISDGLINIKEIHALKRWLKRHQQFSDSVEFSKLRVLINKVIEDKIITAEEQEELLDVFDTYVRENVIKVDDVELLTSSCDKKKSIYQDVGLLNYEEKINEFLADKNTIYVVKGIRDYKELTFVLPKLHECEMNNVIVTEEYDEYSIIPTLLEKLAEKKSYVISYEEFNLLPDAVKSLISVYQYRIMVINNNLYHNYYPIMKGINTKSVIAGLDVNKETISARIWEDYIISKNKLYVSYQSLGEQIETIIEYCNIFDEKDYDENVYEIETEISFDFGQTEEVYLSAVNEILSAESKDINILVGKNGLLTYQKKLLRILNSLGYSIRLIKRIIKKQLDPNLFQYEEILKRKNKDFSFKNLDLYVEPGFTLETQKISQGEIISSLIQNAIKAYKRENYNDIFVTAPTGAGKSVLFQIPAIYLAENYELFTIVITPLIGLMNDQLKNICSMSDKAVTINSEYTPEEKLEIKKQLQNGTKSILYISPETLLSNNPISALIGDRKIGLLVVDEAHIITTWGKSFRPDYWYFGDYINKLRQSGEYSFPIATFSATITYGGMDDMHGDIIDSLKMKTGIYEYVAPMRRDDIGFDINVVSKENDYTKEKETAVIDSLINLYKDKRKTLVYFPFIKQIEGYREKLKGYTNNTIGKYYGSMDKYIKEQFMQDFVDDKAGMMFATKAFGMGIDINDIEVVYHFAPTGNLCDYIQEIGRAARDGNINGVAKTDFFQEDFRYINQLYGMSAITNNHLKAVLQKIRDVYYFKKSRNFTISPDDFAYIFSNSIDFQDVDCKLKTAILMIQKDFELDPYINYKPLIFKPRSIFTKGYFLIQEEYMRKLEKTKYRKYFRLIAKKEDLSIDREYETYIWNEKTKEAHKEKFEQHIRYMGNIYMVDFKRLWEEHYADLTFANFKRMFYIGELKHLEITKEFKPKYLLTVKTNRGTFDEIREKVNLIIDNLIEIFSKPEIGKKHLSIEDIVELLKEIKGISFKAYEGPILAENFINIINNYKKSMQINSYKTFRRNSITGKYIVHSQNVLVSTLKKMKYGFWDQFKSAMSETQKTFLIGNVTEDNIINAEIAKEMQLASFLEAFKLCSYRVTSGERPEYFVRVNSIVKIEKILTSTSYYSKMVKLIHDRHEKSKEVMKKFFTEMKNDDERWDYIERYFVGMSEEENITVNGEKRQEVKHKTMGKGYVTEQTGGKIVVRFYKNGKEAKFKVPNAFEDGFLQKLN